LLKIIESGYAAFGGAGEQAPLQFNAIQPPGFIFGVPGCHSEALRGTWGDVSWEMASWWWFWRTISENVVVVTLVEELLRDKN
jgi:hypothetical protein